MNRELEILELLDEIEIKESEFDSVPVDLMDIEKWNIKKKLRKKLFTGKLIKKITMASSLCLLIITTGVFLSKPAFAEKIQVFENIYKALGYYNDYGDYRKYIGMNKEDKGYIVTIQDLMVTEKTMIFSVKVTSEKPFPKDKNANISFQANMEGVMAGSGMVYNKDIDDKTKLMMVAAETNDSFTKRGTIHMNVNGFDIENNIQMFHVNYDLKVDFSKLFDETKNINIAKKINMGGKEAEIVSLNSSPIETKLFVKNIELVNNDFLLVLDDKTYKGHNGYNDDKITSLTYGVTSKDFENAKTIKVIPRNANIDIFDFDIRRKIDKVTSEELIKSQIFKEEDNVKYPSNYKAQDGVDVDIYKIERSNDKLRIFIHSDKNGFQKALETMVIGLQEYAYVYKDETRENCYVKEFNISGRTDKLEVLPAGINPEYFDMQQPVEIYKK